MTSCPACGWKHSAPFVVCEVCGADAQSPARAAPPVSRRSKWLAIGGAAALVLAVIIVVFWRGGAGARLGGGPSESREGSEWTHKELVEHLRKKGVELESEGGGAWINGLMLCYLIETRNTKQPEAVLDRRTDRSVLAYMLKDEKSAKEYGFVAGKKAVQWGRFVFVSHGHPQADETLNKIRSALDKD